jgi:hypothetical protein
VWQPSFSSTTPAGPQDYLPHSFNWKSMKVKSSHLVSERWLTF